MLAASLADNLLTAPVIAFVVALVATLLRFELRLPEALYPILSTFLLVAIGLKGGKALGASSLGDVWLPLVAAIALGVVTPCLAYLLWRRAGRMSVIDAAALAAHYGSVSAVTFTVMLAVLDARGIAYEGFMAGLLAVLEVIGIVVALFLARGAGPGDGWKTALGEVVRGRSIALLGAGLVVGAIVGEQRLAPTDPLFVGLFTGALTLFLVEMGVVAAERLRDIRRGGFRLVVLGVLVPVVNGSLGVVAGALAGLSTGGVAVMGALAGSASYIAAPAAVRIALPQASPGLYVTASLGITFPFNLTLGIPWYTALAERLA
ncbi:MAG: hypothetical protein RI958_2362 [Actinomycetota bacterium]